MKSFRVLNIKSFLDSGTIELAPITIFVGKNSCGKSSLLRFPAVLAQSYFEGFQAPIVFNGRFVDYGFFKNVIHNQKGDTLSYEFTYDVDIDDDVDARYSSSNVIENHKKSIKNVKMHFDIYSYDKKMVVKSVSMYIDDEMIVEFGVADKKYVKIRKLFIGDEIKSTYFMFELKSLRFEIGGFPIYDQPDLFRSMFNHFLLGDFEVVEDNTVAYEYYKLTDEFAINKELHLTPNEKKVQKLIHSFTRINNIMSHVYEDYKADALMIKYIGPFRESPARIFRDSEKSAELYGVGVKGENVSNILVRDYRRNSKLINEISKWLYPTLGYKIRVEDMNNGFFQIKLIDKYGVVSDISDVGFGVSQVLPIITQIIRNMNSTNSSIGQNIYIEQPELHLHPAAQSQLADLMQKCVEGDNNKTKLVVETHSEHLIRKLQVLISDNKCTLTKDMVKVYYIDKNLQGNAYIKEMKIADNGKFDTVWPSGFFDQAYSLTMELLRNSAEEI